MHINIWHCQSTQLGVMPNQKKKNDIGTECTIKLKTWTNKQIKTFTFLWLLSACQLRCLENSLVLLRLPFVAITCIGKKMMTFKNNENYIHSNDGIVRKDWRNQYDWESKGWCRLMSPFGSDIFWVSYIFCARRKLLEMEYGFLKFHFNVINETSPRWVMCNIHHKRKYPNLYKMRKSSFHYDIITCL